MDSTTILSPTGKVASPSAVPASVSARPSRPTSRILSGSELSPLKILQGRVTGGPSLTSPPSLADGSAMASISALSALSASSTTSATTVAMTTADSRRNSGDLASSSSSTTSSTAASASTAASVSSASSSSSSPPHNNPHQQKRSASGSVSGGQMQPPPAPLGRTPRKITSPDKRFPVKISIPPAATMAANAAAAVAAAAATAPTTAEPSTAVSASAGSSPSRQHSPSSPRRDPSLFAQLSQQHRQVTSHGRQLSLDETIEHTVGLQQAIDILEDEASAMENSSSSSSSQRHGSGDPHAPEPLPLEADEDVTAGIDDTMISTFSSFSAVPNLAMLSKLGSGSTSGTAHTLTTPRASHGTGPLPNRTAHYEHGNTTNLLMDLTEQLRFAHSQQQHQQQHQHPKPTDGALATPQRKHLVNLLDFEIPPLPTPRSIPTVTPRELESLKSNFLSEISGLKATLSGKEAEVLALKTALVDAEKRVGECTEQLREVQLSRQQLAEEKDLWERRGREMDEVLRKVMAEIVLGQREREELEAKVDESEKRREAAEMMAQEAETKMAVMRAGRATAENESNKARSGSGSGTAPGPCSSGSSTTQREVEMAVERVARELHAAYKAKHESKVTALKKSYEVRWEKRVRDVEAAAEALARENETLRAGRDATLSRMVSPEEERQKEEARRQREARDAAQIKALGAEVDKLEAVVKTVKADNGELRVLLEQERVEKGELVMLAEEMMSMQQSFVGGETRERQTRETRETRETKEGPAARTPYSPYAARTSPRGSPRGSPRASSGSNSSSNSHTNGNNGDDRTVTMSMNMRSHPKTPSTTRTMMPSTAGPGTAKRNTMGSGMVPPSAASTPFSVAASAMATPKQARPLSMHGTGRVSGLKPPSSSLLASNGSGMPAPSRIGRLGHDRKQSNAAGLARPGSGLGMRSGGLMSSIEKMGNYRGRGD